VNDLKQAIERARSALIERFIVETVEEAADWVTEEQLLESVNKKLAAWRAERMNRDYNNPSSAGISL